MGTPFPNPKDGATADDGASGQGGQGGRGPATRGRTSASKRQRDLLAPSPQRPPSKVHAAHPSHGVPGPSGIKQCFRTVKSTRRVTFPKIAPRGEPAPDLAPPPEPPPEPPPPSLPPLPTSPKKTKDKHPRVTESESSGPKSLKKHSCKHCNKKFSSPGKLAQHGLSHTGELPFSCQLCDKKFNSKFKLVRHRLIHNEDRPFGCLLCDKTFHRKDHLSNHERIHNPDKSVYVCERENCKKQYTSPLSFRKHRALHLAEEGHLQCSICSLTFETREQIVFHLKVHAGSRTVRNETDKKFNCGSCDRKFFTAKDVRRHMVVHTGNRDFACQRCPQKFGRKDHLLRHVKKAHPEETWRPITTDPGPSTDVTKKGKGEAKKTKGELKFTKSKDPATAKGKEPKEKLYQFKSDRVPSLTPLPFPELFIPPEEESAFLAKVKSEESPVGGVVFGDPSPGPSTSADLGSLMCPSMSAPESLSVSPVGKFPVEYIPGVIYIPPPPPYSAVPAVEMIPHEDVGYRSEENLDASAREALSLLSSQPGTSMQAVLTDRQIMDLLESAAKQQTVLPTFNQTFQNITQSPKPPQRPPE